jgi:hypothetical protein
MLLKHDPPVQLYQSHVVSEVRWFVRRVDLLSLDCKLLVGVSLASITYVPLTESHAELRVRCSGNKGSNTYRRGRLTTDVG